MDVQFYKDKGGRITLKIKRGNGTETWSKLRQGMEDHDLAHVAVEQILKSKTAFFGLLESGVEIDDFEDKSKQPKMSTEALQVEYLVNLLQTEFRNNGMTIDVLNILADTLVQRELPLMDELTKPKLEAIRNSYHASYRALNNLNPGQNLTYQIDHL